MIHVQVYHEKQQEHYLVPIETGDSFQLLKEKLYNKLEGLVEDEEKTFSIFTLEMASPFAKQIKRRNHTPFDSDIVYDVIQRVENIYSGYIILKLVDIRGDGDHWSGESTYGSDLLNQSLLGTSDKHERFGDGESCTTWATSGYNSIGGGVLGMEHTGSGTTSPSAPGGLDALHAVPRLFCTPTLLDSLFMELSGMAVIQGRLNKKITNHRKQDVWREQYFLLDGRMGRLWFFPIGADLSASGGNNIATSANHTRELGASGLGVPSFISLLSGTNTRALDAVTVSTHRSDQTAFTITISETFNVIAGSSPAPLSPFNSRTVTLRAPTAEKAARWVSRLSSLHAMLYQPLLPPSTDNPRLYDQVALKFVNEYAEGGTTYTAAVRNTLAAHPTSAAHQRHHAPPTLSECGGGGGEDAPPVPMTARCSSHWASNSMIESLEDCVASTQQSNTARDADNLESLMSFEGMLKSKYLRGYFQKYLMNNCTEETLLFWEYSEDYWRAHPYTPHPFAPSHSTNFAGGNNAGASTRANATNDLLRLLHEQDAAVLNTPAAVRQWAESLYLTFIHYNAPYQIGCCTGKDMLRVGAAIDKLVDGDMPPYNLFRSIQQSTFTFMKTMCYPDFIAQPNYHRILVAALHAGDRAAMNANVLAKVVASDAEASSFDGFHHNSAPSHFPTAPISAGISPVSSTRGFLGLMRNMVGSKAKDVPVGAVGTSGTAEKVAHSVVDVQSYPARWRIVKLVAFELVRGDMGITTTTGTAASADSVATGSAKYKIGRRRDSRRSIVGDKLKKIRALQNGVYKKITWLPEWWWDLVPAINAQEEGPVWDMNSMSEAGELIEDDGLGAQWTGTEESFLDESNGSEQLSDPPSTGAPLNSWTYSVECGTDWMPTDSNYMKGVFERVRQVTVANQTDHSAGATIHVDLLLDKQLAEEEHANDPHTHAAVPTLFLPAGWKPNAVNNPINSAKVAQLLETPHTLPSMMKYSPTMPVCVSELNLSMGRALLEDYAHLQPSGYHMQVAQAGTGSLILCSVVRCRYLRPSQKQPLNMLMRGFRNSVAIGAPPPPPQSSTDRRSVDSVDGFGSHTPPRANSGVPRRPVASANGIHRSDSVCISSAPLPILSTSQVSYTKNALTQQIVRRSDEFTGASSTNNISEWPRQCAALYLCLGVPRLYLIDPSSLVPSAVLDLHCVRRIAPTEQCLHSIDIQDQTNCVWQISPEGIDADDTRDGSTRWINTLAALCLPSTSVVHIIKSGYLHKRGRLNRAFKLRWFVLCSDLRLHYYKDEQHGVLKGTIELTNDFVAPKDSDRSSHSAGQKQVVRFDKELVVTMQATQRMYTLMAEDVLQAEDWMNVLNDLLSSPVPPGAGTHGPISPLRSQADGSLVHSHELDEEEEDDEEE